MISNELEINNSKSNVIFITVAVWKNLWGIKLKYSSWTVKCGGTGFLLFSKQLNYLQTVRNELYNIFIL